MEVVRWTLSRRISEAVEAATSPGSERVACVRVGFREPGRPRRLHLKDRRGAGTGYQARGRGRSTWRPTERSRRCSDGTAGRRTKRGGKDGEESESSSTAEAGELSPRDPVEGRGHRQVAPVEGKTANTPRLGPVSTSRRIAELARTWGWRWPSPGGPAGTRRRVAKPSVEEPPPHVRICASMPAAPQDNIMVQNWHEELRRLVPVD